MVKAKGYMKWIGHVCMLIAYMLILAWASVISIMVGSIIYEYVYK